MNEEKIKKLIYIKKGNRKEYYNKILHNKESTWVYSPSQRLSIYHLDNCTLVNKDDAYEGGWHDCWARIGTNKKKNLDNLLKRLEENKIEFKEESYNGSIESK